MGEPYCASEEEEEWDLRFCSDYRRFNAVTQKDVFPLLQLDELLDQLRNSAVFSTLDAKSCFWQV